MASLGQTKELEESLNKFSLRIGASLDELAESLSHASKACKAFAADFDAAFSGSFTNPERSEGEH